MLKVNKLSKIGGLLRVKSDFNLTKLLQNYGKIKCSYGHQSSTEQE